MKKHEHFVEALLGDLPQTPWQCGELPSPITVFFCFFFNRNLFQGLGGSFYGDHLPNWMRSIAGPTAAGLQSKAYWVGWFSSEIANNRDIIRIQWDNGIIIWDTVYNGIFWLVGCFEQEDMLLEATKVEGKYTWGVGMTCLASCLMVTPIWPIWQARCFGISPVEGNAQRKFWAQLVSGM